MFCTVGFNVRVLTEYVVDRVPPFLQTIQDPRAAQGGSLKGCPVCGGNVILVPLGVVMIYALFRPRTWHLKLSQAGGRAATANGIPASCARRWRWILASSCITGVSLVQLVFISALISCVMVQCALVIT